MCDCYEKRLFYFIILLYKILIHTYSRFFPILL